MQFKNVQSEGFHSVEASPEAVARFIAWAAEQDCAVPESLAKQAEVKGRCALDFETDPPTAKGMPPGVQVVLRVR